MSSSKGKDRLSELLLQLVASPADEVAWTSLYQQLWPFVVSVAYRRLGESEEAKDVAQEVFQRLLRLHPFDAIRNPNQFRAYIWRMTINAANSHLSRSQFRGKDSDELSAESTEFLDTSANSEERLIWKETLELAKSSLGPDDAKLVNILLSGRSLTEAARELGLTYSNAGVRLHRVRRSLGKVLNIKG